MIEDAELLRRYADEKSEGAFTELVRRHCDRVHATALRQVAGDRHLAQDVTQQVFTALARKAAQLTHRSTLSGWLHCSTHFAASDAVRAERRRKTREQKALTMNLPVEPSMPVDWERMRPMLDAAIIELAERDRDALALRFLDGRSFAEVGAHLGLTENAARMRVERGLDKLRGLLARRGVTSTASALGLVLAQPAHAAPLGLAASVASAAMTGAGAGGILLGIFTMSKITTGISGAAIVALAVTTFVEVRANRELRADLRTLSAQADGLTRLQQENTRLEEAVRKEAKGNPGADALSRLKRRAAVLAARPAGIVDADLKPASRWGNVGRATPEAAFETLHWAMFANNLDEVARFVVFEDDSAEAREAFMARFSEATRMRYRTPERLLAAAFFGAGGENGHSPADAFAFIGEDDHVGGNGSRIGQRRMRVWYSLATGKEFEGSTRWQPTPDGWAAAGFSLAKDWKLAASRLDPATGSVLPPPKP